MKLRPGHWHDGNVTQEDVPLLRALLFALLALPFQPEATAPASISPLEITVPHRAGTRHEVHVTNLSAKAIDIEGLSVRDASSDNVVATYDKDTLAAHAWRPSGLASALQPGERMVVYVDLDKAGRLPLRHDVAYRIAGDKTSAVALGSPVAPDVAPLPQLGPPLRGGPWAAIYDPMLKRGHRRVVYVVNGVARIPGRFAIDWMHVDVAGKDHAKPTDEVLAVADGVVVGMRSDMPDVASDPSSIPLKDGTGNYVVIDIGNGRFAFYEHLTRAVTVTTGQRVRRGDVIGHIGASGHAVQPHLHFHVADAHSALGAEGQPYDIIGLETLGNFESIDAFGQGKPWRAWPRPDRASRFPVPGAVVMFPDAPRP